MASRRRYPTDLTDRQWGIVEGLLPPPRSGGRSEKHPRREVVNAILYHVRAGGSWRMLPKDFPPWQTVYWYFKQWRDDGSLDRLHDALRDLVREREGRSTQPTAGITDSQSVKGADTVGADSRGFDAGKKINGRKRHIVTDTLGLLLVVMVTAASVQDRDAARDTVTRAAVWYPSLLLIWADSGYAGKLVDFAKLFWKVTIDIVTKKPDQRGFEVLPRRWVVERTFSWMMRFRRLCRDYERLPQSHEAMVKWAMVAIMLNRLSRPPQRRAWSTP